MKILFVHQNMPGQFKHLAPALAADGHEVVFITKSGKPNLPGVRKVEYKPHREPKEPPHRYFDRFEDQILHGQAVVKVCLALKETGFEPDVICAHTGWGEALFLKDAFPEARLLTFNEFFYRGRGTDTDFLKEDRPDIDRECRTRVRNAHMLVSMAAADWGYVPTYWQWSTHPKALREKMSVIHDGIDTDFLSRQPDAYLDLADGRRLTADDEVVTYVARNLEPYRGFDVVASALKGIQAARPNAHIVVTGGEDVSYGSGPGYQDSWKDALIPHLELDASRLHFMGRLPYEEFGRMLSISRAHIYLTYPFVLSWSMLEAMSRECLVVASDTPPVREVIHNGKNGLLVPYSDSAKLVSTVAEALAKGKDMDRVRKAARQTVIDRYDLKTVCLPQLLDIVAKLGRREMPEPTTQIPAEVVASMGWPSTDASKLSLWSEMRV
ncbi:glycosyltransferase family 4 protein [Nisaea acidiphila]|uniref:Glycosyltransferase family 4 protein n=1 Tax=Nisaea acidiphila TaxID=1862145 RepID=A0A9J7AN67_9PROT|nr:glycosyltransferase family 4 protein [Nisaea acidiphila]UUX48394.1 glycosyltransferase family 4 protein [Nisaea acidiphila]